MSDEFSTFAKTIYEDKYAHTKRSGRKETWAEIANRVSANVLGVVDATRKEKNRTARTIRERKFMPGGRYLYASGRPFHQTQNCLLLRAEDSREGWSELLKKSSMALMTGAGIGIQYSEIRGEGASIRRTGGVATGPIALMQMINECGRGIMQGGSRRCLPEGTSVTMADFTKKNIEDVKVGDEVLTRFGPRKVLNVFDQGVQDLYRIETEHGSVHSTRRHRWLCSNTSRTKTFYVPVEKLSLSCKLHYHPSPVIGGDSLDTDWAYVLGFYLGDGCAYSSGRTHEVTFQVDRPRHNHDRVRLISNTIEKRFGVTPHVRKGHGEVTEVRCRSKELVSFFQDYKRPNEPFSIPEEITNASLEARCAFIAGWFDADGCYSDSWKLSNKWPEVRAQVMSFLAGLGFLSTETGNEVRICDYQRSAWRSLVSPFSFKRPKGRSYTRSSSEIPSQILSISKAGEGRTYDIEVDDVHEFIADGFVSHNSAIWAGLRWSHPDVTKFIRLKDWQPEVRALKEKDFNFPATLDMTNISVCLDDEFFIAYNNEKHLKHTHAHLVYWEAVGRMLKTGEPGFSVDCGPNSGEDLRNAPVSAETYVLLKTGYARVGDIVGEAVVVWTGRQWAETTFTKTAEDTPVVRVNMTGGKSIVCDPSHEFLVERWTGAGRKLRRMERIERVPAKSLKKGDVLHTSLTVPPGSSPYNKDEWYALGYIYGDGSFHRRYPRSEVTFCRDDSKECLARFPEAMLTSVTLNDARGYTRAYTRNHHLFERRAKRVFPEDAYSAPPECRASFVAGLFDAAGNWYSDQKRLRLSSAHREFLVGVRRLLESLGIRAVITKGGTSTYGKKTGWLLVVVTEDVETFRCYVPTLRVVPDRGVESYRPHRVKVTSVEDAGREDVFCCDVGVEEHSFQAEGVIISNCTEICSFDDSDICNLGSINMARVQSLDEMRSLVVAGTRFLLAGTVYSDVPYHQVDVMRRKNRRLGLGLMGIHEWLLKRGKPYGPDEELEEYLKVYRDTSREAADAAAKEWGLSIPVKLRAIAPTGTIGNVAETTTGIEPVFCVAFKRRYLKHKTWAHQYVLDPTAKRLIESGVPPLSIEDAYVLAQEPERRVSFQSWLQKYVDHGISSTINLPAWGTEHNNSSKVQEFGTMLVKYLPTLRGITAYPDGARGGQPLTPVRYETAMRYTGKEYYTEESVNVCDLTKGGSCGE